MMLPLFEALGTVVLYHTSQINLYIVVTSKYNIISLARPFTHKVEGSGDVGSTFESVWNTRIIYDSHTQKMYLVVITCTLTPPSCFRPMYY